MLLELPLLKALITLGGDWKHKAQNTKKNEVNRIVQSIKQNRFRCKTPMFALKKARQFNYPKLIIRSGVEQVRKQESMLEKVFVVV